MAAPKHTPVLPTNNPRIYTSPEHVPGSWTVDRRIINDVTDARSAVRAAFEQISNARRNVELGREIVTAEQRAFELGRSDLLRIQLREVQLADAQVLELDAKLAYRRAHADLRAALGHDAATRNP